MTLRPLTVFAGTNNADVSKLLFQDTGAGAQAGVNEGFDFWTERRVFCRTGRNRREKVEAELERHPGVLLLRLKGDMRLWGRSELGENMLQQLRSALEESPAQLVLNMSGLANLDTMGIASLVRILVECTKHKTDLKVIMPGGLAGEALRRVRVFEVWPSFPDEASALRATATAGS